MPHTPTEAADIFDRRYDVAIFGSGAGGGTLAYALARRGRRVLLLEKGDFLPPEPDNRSEFGVFGEKYNSTEEMEICGRRYPATVHSFVGGQTKLYGAALYRLRREDFGELEFSDGISPAWPIDYSDLEPYYDESERIYKVHGDADQDPTEPPHRNAYPYPPIEHEDETRRLVDSLSRQGFGVHPIPKAIRPEEPDKCTFCATCDAYACPTGGKLDTEIACIRPALKTGNLTLVTGARCERLETDRSGTTVVGAEVSVAGSSLRVDAAVFVVACGIMHSPALLLRSVNAKHPAGLGNQHDQVGRNLAGHNSGLFFLPGLFRRPAIHQKTFAVNDLYLGDPGWPHPLGVMQAAGQIPLWRFTEAWLKPVARFVSERSMTCFIMTEVWPDPDNRVSLDADDRIRVEYRFNNKAGFRRLRMHFLKAFWKAGYLGAICSRHPVGGLPFHPVGTLRFGRDPETSVVDPDCRVHGIDNLLVVDSCVLPSAGAVNTSLTVMAIALRAGEFIDGLLAGESRAQSPDDR